jgi:hypothetical protein
VPSYSTPCPPQPGVVSGEVGAKAGRPIHSTPTGWGCLARLVSPNSPAASYPQFGAASWGIARPKSTLFGPLAEGKTAFSIAPEGVETENVKIGKTILCTFVRHFSILFRGKGFFAFSVAFFTPWHPDLSMRSPSYPQSTGSGEFHPARSCPQQVGGVKMGKMGPTQPPALVAELLPPRNGPHAE